MLEKIKNWLKDNFVKFIAIIAIFIIVLAGGALAFRYYYNHNKIIKNPIVKIISPNGDEYITLNSRNYIVKWSVYSFNNLKDLRNYYIKIYLVKGGVALGVIDNKISSAFDKEYNWGWIRAGNYFDKNGNIKTAVADNDYKIKVELYKLGISEPVSQIESANYFSIINKPLAN